MLWVMTPMVSAAEVIDIIVRLAHGDLMGVSAAVLALAGLGQALRLIISIQAKLAAKPPTFNQGLLRALNGPVDLERRKGDEFFRRFGFERQSREPSGQIEEAIRELAGRRPAVTLDSASPRVSIIIPAYGQTPFVLSCLDALSQHVSRQSVEIIVADDASPEHWRMDRLANIPWLHYAKRQKNLGFVQNCNEAASSARGEYLVFLNSDTRVVGSWLDELIGSFAQLPRAGLVGSALLNEDGTLQESGSLYWADGTASNYGRGQDPRDPRYRFAHQPDYCSAAAVAVLASAWRDVGGFDGLFSPAYCEDADLAFRLRERGFEVWVQPLSQVLHYEGVTHGRDVKGGMKAHQVTNMGRFVDRWSHLLRRHGLPGDRPGGYPDRGAQRHLLVIDNETPKPDRDSGSVITVAMIKAFRELGWQITFVPQSDYEYAGSYTDDLQRLGVECLYRPFVSHLPDLLRRRRDFDAVLVFRTGVLAQVHEQLRRRLPRARLIFHNVDLHYVREEREAELQANADARERAAKTRAQELALIAASDCTIVHTEAEKEVIRQQIAADNIIVFPYVAEPSPAAPGFEARKHVMFLGGFAHRPNQDAVVSFVSDIWPLIVTSLPDDAQLLVVGADPPPAVMALASDRVVVTGYVADLAPYFAQARVFVAPLRYGAGIKGKVVQSLAHGCPSVLTSVAAEGMDLLHGQHAIIADGPEAFADGVLRLYGDPRLWQALQSAGLELVRDRYSWQRCLELCAAAVAVADDTWRGRQGHTRFKHVLERARNAAIPSG
jgi:GT2 family glycosyltransferase/glycosyltransferase involved in cell wall biosynthesis